MADEIENCLCIWGIVFILDAEFDPPLQVVPEKGYFKFSQIYLNSFFYLLACLSQIPTDHDTLAKCSNFSMLGQFGF